MSKPDFHPNQSEFYRIFPSWAKILSLSIDIWDVTKLVLLCLVNKKAPSYKLNPTSLAPASTKLAYLTLLSILEIAYTGYNADTLKNN